MNEELNRKLAEWAGFEYSHKSRIKNFFTGGLGRFIKFWVYPGGYVGELPDFTESLDACFKWLVPKLEPLGYDLQIDNDLEMLGWSVCLSNTKSGCSIASPMEHCELDGIALTLCKVIEKMVGNEG